MQRVLMFCFGMMFSVISLYAQTSLQSLIQEGDAYYQEEQYNAAIPFYQEVSDKDLNNADINYKLAECYRKTFNYTEAETYYLKAYFLGSRTHQLSLYYYALMLKLNANFDEAIIQFDEFIAQHENDDKLKEYVEQALIDKEGSIMAKANFADKKNSSLVSPMPVGINSEYNDYAPAVKDSITFVITSGRISSNRNLIDERFGEAFSDNYFFQKANGVYVDKTRQSFDGINSKYNDGSGCFNSKGDKYYFTVCGKEGSQCRIFLSSLKAGKWTEPIALNANVNFKSYEAKQPAIAHGGDTLLFVSNRPGGLGQYDIWMTVNSGEEDWGPAMNMGPGINTKLNEMAPSLTSYQHIIFFASDGHEGYGGLDLYMSKKLTSGESILYNLDYPFNSNRDDCFISFSEKHIFYSSNRKGGFGGFDIYSENISSPISFISKVSLKNHNARRDIKLKSKTEKSEHLELLASRNEEKIEYENLTYEKRKIVDKLVEGRIRSNGTNSNEFGDLSISEFNTLNTLSQERYEAYLLQKKFNNSIVTKVTSPNGSSEDLSITGILIDSATHRELSSVTLLLADESGEVLKTTRTNDKGKFRFTDVPAGKQLYIRLEKSLEDEAIRAVVINVKTENSADQNIVYAENIYFDFDHYVIRPEASKVLDALADYLMQHPGVQVEIFAFADDRGGQEYNLRLTQKRGQSVVDYLSHKGVDATSLAIISKGKQTYATIASDVQRQYSRRVEFYLNGVKEPVYTESKTLILKRSNTWSVLAQLTGSTKEALQKLNNTKEENLKASQPVRIPVDTKSISSDLFFAGI